MDNRNISTLRRPAATGHPPGYGSSTVYLRDATIGDLDAINAVVAAAMQTWGLSERVLRLSLPLYRYAPEDLRHQQLLLAEGDNGTVIGMAAFETAEASPAAEHRKTALLHGIYIDPRHHRRGVGTRLLARVEASARQQGFDGLLSKANPAATGFFETRGFECLPIVDSKIDYPYRYWKKL